ncbi:MAG TPA: hypothetical protein VE690_12020 [Rhodopila sp.]|nr:hypothetical protein [Rhodopila sp.]
MSVIGWDQDGLASAEGRAYRLTDKLGILFRKMMTVLFLPKKILESAFDDISMTGIDGFGRNKIVTFLYCVRRVTEPAVRPEPWHAARQALPIATLPATFRP